MDMDAAADGEVVVADKGAMADKEDMEGADTDNKAVMGADMGVKVAMGAVIANKVAMGEVTVVKGATEVALPSKPLPLPPPPLVFIHPFGSL